MQGQLTGYPIFVLMIGALRLKHLYIKILKNANQERERFTILDLAVILGIMPEKIEEIISDWVTD
jgi:hypothetical protein